MNRTLKLLLIWLMMAALPVQGMAAVLKLSCASRHHAIAATAAHAHDADHAMHAHAGHHAAGADMQAHDDGSHGDHGVHKADKSDKSDARCSACAACGFGAAAPPPALTWAPQFAVATATSFLPAVPTPEPRASGLERPPRLHSA
ncbi:hypothetical protein E4K72_18455 [Oxalobacteraceae bacterium OM1]|nr:hypothetical protein E4K72_18455 [Oxalobacteraceae bacterium OM1]